MASKKLTIETNATNAVHTYWIAVDNRVDVATNHKAKGSISLKVGKHRAMYWAIGTPGGSLTIVGKVSGKEIFKRVARIPSDGDVANSIKFNIS